MGLTIHCSLFHVLSNWFKRLASFCVNQSNHRRRVSLKTNKKHIQNYKLLQICRACSRNCNLRNSRELKQQWRQQLRKRHLKNKFNIPPRSIRQVLSNLSGVEIIKNVLKYRKRKRKSLSCVHLLHKTWNKALSRRSRAVTAKKCTITRDARAKLLFCLFKPIAFLTIWLTPPSTLLKLPYMHGLPTLHGLYAFIWRTRIG